jgi:predicted transcriptional regulator
MEETRFIGDKRRRLGITQHALARAAGVSQSLIAKIEAGSVDAAYSKVRRIIEALEHASLGKEKSAREIMHTGIQSASPSQTLHSAAAEMRKKSISQMPVVEKGQLVGSLTEEALLKCFSSGKRLEEMSVREAMGEPFPSVLPSTPVSSVASLLRYHPAVLVSDKGKLSGIITKADILKSI